MSAISAQSHSRSTSDPSSGSAVAAWHMSPASRVLHSKKIASLHARERQGATRAIEVMGGPQEPLQRARDRRGLRSAMNSRPCRPVKNGAEVTKGDLTPSRIDY
jgi:hypothetical protein